MNTDETRGDAHPSPEDESDWDLAEPSSDETRGMLRDAVHQLYSGRLTPGLLGRDGPLPVHDLGQNRPLAKIEPDRTQFKLLQQATEHLADIADQARADAKEARADAEQSRTSTRHALWAAWTAVTVTVVVGVIQIVMAVNA